MRFKWPDPKPAREGEVRVRQGFIFFKTIRNETRFLEWSRWEERYLKTHILSSFMPPYTTLMWRPTHWLPDVDESKTPYIGFPTERK